MLFAKPGRCLRYSAMVRMRAAATTAVQTVNATSQGFSVRQDAIAPTRTAVAAPVMNENNGACRSSISAL
jgi:hypothetical protein